MLSSSSTIKRLGIGIEANEARSQESEVTIKEKEWSSILMSFLTAICQDRCAVPFKQSTGFFQLAHFKITVPVTQIGGENQIVATLLNGSLSNIHETRFVALASFLEAFRDVCRDRNGSPSKLRCQNINLFFREPPSVLVRSQNKLMRFLPD